MKQNLFNKLWLRVGMIVAIMTTALAGTAWADTSTLTFTAACGGSGTANDGVAWTVTSDAAESNYDGTKGIHYGTSSVAVSYLNLSTSGISGTITKVVVNASGASKTSAKLNVTIGGNAFGSEQSLTATATDYTLSGSASGEIIVSLTQTSAKKALYCKSITVTYTPAGSSAIETTTTINTAGITNTDVHTSTAAGSLAAIVKDANNNVISDAAVTWSSSNENVATVASNGTVTLVAAGKTNITASYAGVANQYLSSVSDAYVLTVTDSTPFEGGDVTFVAGTDVGSTSGNTTPDQMTKSVVTIYSNDAAFATDQYRMYKNSETTFSVPDNYYITQIVFTDADENYPCSNLNRKNGTAGTYNQETNTWTGASKTVVFVASAQARASQITVTVASGEIPPTPTNNYTVTFNVGDGTFVGNTDFPNTSNDVEEGTYTLPSATRDGYTFDGWMTTESTEPLTGSYTVSGDVAFTAQYTQNGGETGEGEGIINFGNNGTKINSTSVTGDDSMGNTWTITTTFTGETSFTQSSNYSQVGASSKPASSITFTTTLPEEVKVTSMEAKFGGFSSTAGDVTLKVGNTTIGTGSLNGTNDVTVESTSTAEGSVLTVTVTGIAKGVKCYYISYTYEAASSGVATETTITIPSNFNSDIHNGTSAGTLTATVTAEGNAISGAAITWTSSDTDVATIDANGAVTLVAVGTTIITASYAGVEDQYRPSSESYELTVIDSYSPGTANNPYTVTEALEVIGALVDGGKTETEVYTTGIISQIDEISTSFGNATYWISVDGTTTNQMEVYRGKYLDNANFTDESQIQVGDKVIVYGKLQKYVKDEVTTPEIAQGNYIVSQLTNDAPTTITLNSDGYATFASTSAVDLDETEGCTAWAITGVSGSAITFTQVEGVVAAGTGLLLKGAAGATIYPEYSTNAGSAVTGNKLEAILTPTTIVADQYYGLSGKTFVKVNAGTVPAGKALLPASALISGVKTFTFIFDDDDATAISTVESFTEEGAIYNVAGQRISKMQKGINIVNGKKVLK